VPDPLVPDASAEPGTAKRRAGGVIGVVIAVVFVLTAGSVAVAIYALRGSSESLGRMVPADVDVYVSVNLDPAASQKANVAQLASKFPSLHDANGIRGIVESALDDVLHSVSPTLSFQRDVEPWLGSQVVLVADVSHGGRAAFLVASKDDDAAQSALARATSRAGGHWTTAVHGGVTIHVGSGEGTGAEAYAVMDHAAIIGSRGLIESVVDADQGTAPRLTDSASYTRTVSSLPTDRLALVYVNYPSLVKDLQGSGVAPGLFGSVSGGISPAAYVGLGVALSAESSGVALDMSVPLDTSKLTAEDRAILSSQRDAGPLLAWIPAPTSFFLAAPRAPLASLFDAVDQSPFSAGLGQELGRLGISGPDGLEQHLTGDIVVEAGVGGTSPGGAVLLGTDDEAAMQSTLDRLARRFAPKLLASSSSSVSVPSKGKLVVRHGAPRMHWDTVTDDGVTIRFATDPAEGSSWMRPAYAVSDGMGIVGTSPEAVQAVLDTKAGGPSIENAPEFVLAAQHVGTTQGDVVFLNFRSLMDLFGGGQASSDLRALQSLIVTDHYTSDLITERVFLSIG
jgi:Protein of unknown function (DUF3352)